MQNTVTHAEKQDYGVNTTESERMAGGDVACPGKEDIRYKYNLFYAVYFLPKQWQPQLIQRPTYDLSKLIIS